MRRGSSLGIISLSAIFGFIHFEDRPVHVEELERMNSALASHGRDGGGTWIQGRVGLGHRLMCFTPEDRFEKQPLVAEGEQIALVFDGRIDNRPELSESLGIAPGEARLLPDSVFVLRAYDKWADRLTDHLVGSYAVAIWDKSLGHLLAFCSPTEKRAFHYYLTTGVFAFATLPKGLFALPFIPRTIDRKVLAAYLSRTPIAEGPDATLYQGVHRLLSGEMLKVRMDGRVQRSVWQPDLNRKVRYTRDADYVEAFDELFTRAVKDRLRSLTPVGVMMSGGLDSTSVAAVAAPILRLRGERLTAFTEVPIPGFSGLDGHSRRYGDETPFAKAMAAMYDNIDLCLVQSRSFFLDNVVSSFEACDEPFKNAYNRPWFEEIYACSKKRNVRVLLTGSQGNLTISWPGLGILPDLVREKKWCKLFREARIMAGQGHIHTPLLALLGMDRILLQLYRSMQWLIFQSRPQATVPPGSISIIHPVFAREQGVGRQFGKALYNITERWGVPIRYRKIRWNTLRGMGERESRMTAGYQSIFGVENRDPTNDLRLAEFCLSLPEDQFWKNGQSRQLIRRAMSDRLPPEILNNPKRGLQAADWRKHTKLATGRIQDELARLKKVELAREAIDLERLRDISEKICSVNGPNKKKFKGGRSLMENGLMTGRFLRWVETGE